VQAGAQTGAARDEFALTAFAGLHVEDRLVRGIAAEERLIRDDQARPLNITLDGVSNGTGEELSPVCGVAGKRPRSDPSGPITAIWLLPASAA
jgi:hypothetical protein